MTYFFISVYEKESFKVVIDQFNTLYNTILQYNSPIKFKKEGNFLNLKEKLWDEDLQKKYF